MLARLLYRDGLMLVVDKPADAGASGPKGRDAFEDYFDALRFGLPTVGAGTPARPRHHGLPGSRPTPQGAGSAGKLFNGQRWQMLLGRGRRGPEADEGRIDIALAKRDDTRGWWMKADSHGLPSASTWKIMGRGPGVTWLALEPLTGRTHQLRVHCAEMGWPVIGDNIYGKAPRAGGPPLHLHSREVTVPISKNKPPVKVTAPVPVTMREKLSVCGWKETGE